MKRRIFIGSVVAAGLFFAIWTIGNLAISKPVSAQTPIPTGCAVPSFGAMNSIDVGAKPVGATTGDFNQDGKLDAAVAGFNSGMISIYPGDGAGGLGTPVNLTVGTNPVAVAKGDLDRNGKIDLIVTNAGSNNVSILLNRGGLQFDAAVTISTGLSPRVTVVGDFNRDGKADLVVANRDSDNISVFLGSGNGAFAAATNYATGPQPVSITINDFNRDGKLDLVVGANRVPNLTFLFGDGNGGFNTPTALEIETQLDLPLDRDFVTQIETMEYESIDVISGDLDRDGNPDLAWSLADLDLVLVSLGDGKGGFGQASSIATGRLPRKISIGDVNGDGKPDLAVGLLGSNSVKVMLGDGAGAFPQKADYPVVSTLNPSLTDSRGNDLVNSPAAEMMEYDAIEAIVGNDHQVNAEWMDYESIDRSSRLGGNRVMMEWIDYDAIEDFNGDGRRDLLVVSSLTNTVGVMLNTCVAIQCPGIAFASQTQYPVADGATAIVRGDFNNDDNTDLATANWATHDISIFLGNRNGEFQYKAGPTLGSGTSFFVYSMATADFNRDGNADLAVAGEGQNKVWIFLGLGNGNFNMASNSPFNVPGGPYSIAMGHFNDDDNPDLVTGNRYLGTVSIFRGQGDGTFEWKNDQSIGFGETRFVGVADFDLDRKYDIVAAGVSISATDNDQIMVLFGDGNFKIDTGKTWRTFVFDRPRSIAIADFNHDGRRDIAVCNEGTDNIYVFLQVPNAVPNDFVLAGGSPFKTGDFPISMVSADLDRDGHYDLATANFNSNDVVAFRGDGTGRFTQAGSYKVGTQPYALVKGAFDYDGRIDLATANLTSDTVSVLLNRCTYTPKPKIEAAPSSLDFKTVKLTSSSTLDLTIRNAGTDNLVVSDLSASPAVFSYTAPSRPITIPVGSSVTVKVTFTPLVAELTQGFLVITNNDASELTLKVPLSGVGYCGFIISPPGPPPMTPLGGTDSFVVNGSSGCSYTAVSNDDWITITAGAGGTGGQSVGYSVAANTSAATRTGTITVSGETFVVTQSGTAGGCTTPTFKPAVSVGVTPGATSVVTADFNQDGKPDLAVASWDLKMVKILLGDGNGGFTEMAGPSLLSGVGFYAYNLAAGDFDGDNNPDLAVANEAANSIQVFKGNGAFGFTQFLGSPINVGNGPYSLDAADLDNDGLLDLVTANRYSNTVWVLKGNGSGNFTGTSIADLGPTLKDLRTTTVGDVNLDSKLDLAVAGSDTNNVLVLKNKGSLMFEAGTPLNVGNRPKAVAIADLDLDGKPDLVVTNEGDDKVSVFKGDGTGAFRPYPIPPVIPSSPFPTGDFPIAVAVRDFNFDGYPDIATANFNSNDVTVLLGNGGGLFRSPFSFSVGTRPFHMAVGDFNLDGKPDLATANLNSADVSILLNDCSALPSTADLSITKTDSVVDVAPGLTTSYEIVVTNNGPNVASGARVVDTLPPQIASATWQCTTTTGSTCLTSAGSGNIDILVNLPAGGKATIILNAAIGATASGSVSNSATVSPPAGVTDPVLGNNSATDVDTITARIVRIVSSSGAPGIVVSLPVEIDSQGDENAIGFSVVFDPTILGNPQATLGADAAGATLATNPTQVSSGRFGIGLLLPPGQSIVAGRRQIVILRFTIAAGAAPTMTTIDFIDQPVKREIVDKSVVVLPAIYLGGKVTVVPGFEGDVSPRPNGNMELTIGDWAQIQRFVAGIDLPAIGSEFQRVDTAPKASLGDGVLTASDVVQGGRYAIGLDPPTPAGGPSSPLPQPLLSFLSAADALQLLPIREVRAIGDGIERGQNGTVAIEFASLGTENAITFSLVFDPVELTYVKYITGSGTSGMSILVNDSQAAMGRIGIVLAMPPGQAIDPGSKQLLILTFAAREQGNPGTTAIGFANQPVQCEVADVAANPLGCNWATLDLQLSRTVTGASAADYGTVELAAESIIAAFGRNMATTTLNAPGIPLPTELGGTTVKVKDSAGVERLAPLFFVSPQQINFQIPAGTATGTATLIVTSGDGVISSGPMVIAALAPSLFTADASGHGLAAAQVLRVKPDGSFTYENVFVFDAILNKTVAVPIEFSPQSDQIYLILFGTGIRGRSSSSAVTVSIGGTGSEVLYAGAQGEWVGLDQVNVALNRSLAGRGEVDVVLTADGKNANTVRVAFK